MKKLWQEMNTVDITFEFTLLWGEISWWWQCFPLWHKLLLSYPKRKGNEKWGLITRLLWSPYRWMHLLLTPHQYRFQIQTVVHKKRVQIILEILTSNSEVSVVLVISMYKTSHTCFFYNCIRYGNTKDRCYKIHGYPYNSKFFKGKCSIFAGMAKYVKNEAVKVVGNILN